MDELNFITEMIEERLVKGNFRWLANFSEIHKDYVVGDIVFPIYASGTLREKGFFLSKLYSTVVTPNYKIHFFFYTTAKVDPQFLRKVILSCKGKFGRDDWVFLGLVQSQPLEKNVKESIAGFKEKNIGITVYSVESEETVTSDNVLGRGLTRQLSLGEAKFEAFDWPNYLKSFTIVFGLGMLLLVVIALSGLRDAIQLLTILIMFVLSTIVGYRIYKTRYHVTLTLDGKGFLVKDGARTKEGKWSSYEDVTIRITPNYETYLRLYGKKETLDIPISRVGISRKEAYEDIRDLVKKYRPASR